MDKKRFFISLFICFLSISAFSKGSAEEDYATARSLLEESKNTAALQDIVNVIENKPESIESGISLARKTMENQAEFQKTFHELIELLKVDPGNNLKRIAIINKMEILESDMDPDLRAFLDKVKISSFYAIYRIKFNDLMSEGIKLIEEKKYNDAAKTFIQGFSMYDGEAMDEDKNVQISSVLKNELDSVKSDTKKYEDAYAEFISDVNKYRAKAFSSSLSSLENELNALKNSSSRLRSITGSLIGSGASLKQVYLNERKKNVEIEESIFPFAYRLTIGRDSAKEYEGVEGAMEAGVHEPLYSLADSHWLEIKKLWFESCDTFDFESDISIDKNLSLIDFHLKSLTGIYSVINTRSGSRFGKTVDSQDKKRNSLAELNKIIDSAKKYYSRFLAIREKIQPISSSYTGSSDELRDSGNPKIKTLKAEIQELESMIVSVKKLSESSIPHIANDLGKEQEALEAKNSLLSSNMDKARLLCYEELAIINNKSGKKAFAEIKQRYDSFMNNKQKTDKTSPAEIRQELLGLKEIIKLDLRILNNFIKDTDPSVSESSKVFADNKNGIETTITSLKELSGIIDSDLALTESAILKIKLAKNEADLRFEEAKRNLKSGNFSAARRNIELSRTRTNDALQLEEDEEYRQMTDERLDK